jgi:hypothetical protein
VALTVGSKIFEGLYQRRTFFSEYLSVGNWMYYWLINILGSFFVNIVNLNNYRHNPTYDSRWTVQSFVKMTVFLTPLLYLWSPVVVLRGGKDLDGYCQIQEAAGIEPVSLKLQSLSEFEQAALIFQSYSEILESKENRPHAHNLMKALTESTHFTAPELVRGAASVEVDG